VDVSAFEVIIGVGKSICWLVEALAVLYFIIAIADGMVKSVLPRIATPQVYFANTSPCHIFLSSIRMDPT
jgi:hypothetical protein